MHKYNLGGIEDAREAMAFFQSRANNKTAIMHALGIFRENPLPRRKHAAAEDPPLSAMRVSADDQIER